MSTGDKAEKRAAARLKATLQPASGALPGAKGDYHIPEFKVEHKATEKRSYSVKLADLQKVTGEGADDGRTPAFHITFCSGNGQPRRNGSWIMIPEWAFKEMTGIE
jgi:hypothetical protein